MLMEGLAKDTESQNLAEDHLELKVLSLLIDLSASELKVFVPPE